MAAQHPNFTRVDVPGQGHAPLLRDESTQAAIEKFIAQIDTPPSAAPKDAEERGFSTQSAPRY